MSNVSSNCAPLNTVNEHKVARKLLRVLNGTRSATPTLAIPNFLPFGLLLFLNEKQSQVQRVLFHDHPDVQLHGNTNTAALLSAAEFLNFIVGGLIVEAERVDEMVIQLRKQIVVVENEVQCIEMDLKLSRRTLSSGVQQTLATHYREPPRSRVHSVELQASDVSDAQSMQIRLLNQSLAEKKMFLTQLRQQLKACVRVQRVLHGQKDSKSLHAVPQETASDIIADMSILISFRKAQHCIRDAVYDLREGDATSGTGLAAISSLQEYIDYVDWGLSAALDDLEGAELKLRKLVKVKSTEAALSQLDRQDIDNKQMSCAALRYNQAVNSPRSTSVRILADTSGIQHSSYNAVKLENDHRFGAPYMYDPPHRSFGAQPESSSSSNHFESHNTDQYQWPPANVAAAMGGTPNPATGGGFGLHHQHTFSAGTGSTNFSPATLMGRTGFVYTPPTFLPGARESSVPTAEVE
eukprot:PhM_4_TR12795/c0_g1_i1/m.48496